MSTTTRPKRKSTSGATAVSRFLGDHEDSSEDVAVQASVPKKPRSSGVSDATRSAEAAASLAQAAVKDEANKKRDAQDQRRHDLALLKLELEEKAKALRAAQKSQAA